MLQLVENPFLSAAFCPFLSVGEPFDQRDMTLISVPNRSDDEFFFHVVKESRAVTLPSQRSIYYKKEVPRPFEEVVLRQSLRQLLGFQVTAWVASYS